MKYTFSPARMKAARARRKMTQQQLADAAGVNWSFVAKLECGTSSLPDSPIRLAKILRVKPEELYELS